MNQELSMTPSLLMAGWNISNISKYNKLSKIAVVAAEIVDEYSHNRKFYHDLIKFNFFNGVKSKKTYAKICFGDPPPEVKRQLNRLYKKKYYNFSDEWIYLRLGLRQTKTNKHSPLETKWAYSYYKKYGHWDYSERNVVTDEEILQPLTCNERLEYMKLF